jgi:hypothetical protein
MRGPSWACGPRLRSSGRDACRDGALARLCAGPARGCIHSTAGGAAPPLVWLGGRFPTVRGRAAPPFENVVRAGHVDSGRGRATAGQPNVGRAKNRFVLKARTRRALVG